MLVGIILLLVLFSMLDYLLLIPLGGFWCTYFFFGLFIVLLIGTISFVRSRKRKHPIKAFINASVLSVLVYFIITLLICFFTSSIFMANSYKKILPAAKEKEFSKEVEPFDVSKSPIVTESTAKQIADKYIGQDGSLGSRANMDEVTLQNINGSLYWVAPLEHSGFFAWLNNKEEGTPYIMVNANTKECKLVKDNIRYQPGAYFGQDLARKLFLTNMSYGYTDFTFEIDDQGKPYWTASAYKNTIGFSGSVVVGTAVVNAETGEVKIYSVKDTPKWVDRIQPEDFVVRDINWSGKYIHGFTPFNNNDKIKTTEGSGIVYNNGECYYYTGITSIGKDEGTLGFYLVDTRTMDTTYFKMSGATETSAIKSAEGKVQNLGYTGSFPILMNIENTPTYFVPLQDKNDLTKLYAMVNVEDYTVIATGETVDQCKEAYLQLLFTKNKLSNSQGVKREITGIVKRLGSYTQQGNTFYTIQLDTVNLIFIIPVDQSSKLPITKEGDTVTIKYVDANIGGTVASSGFDNISIK